MTASRPAACFLLAAGLLSVRPVAGEEGEWSGLVALELRGFASDPVAADQATDSSSLSFSFEPEYYRDWSGGGQSFLLSAFLRYDGQDEERTHADLRELYWRRVGHGWEWTAGVRKVFWGVTESHHLVDIVNQTDLVEDIDGEEKLGQPMLSLALIRRWGTLDIFLLPGFRERTFPGGEGRIRPSPRVAPEEATYQSGTGDSHVGWALRWSATLGDWDLGLAHFSGTGREPRLVPAVTSSLEPVLAPHYELIDQSSLDLQATKGGWLWKLEAISRRDRVERFAAAVGGFEYTFGNIRASGIDLGLLGEYLYDERGELATTSYDDDVFLAARLTFNDAQDSSLLVGAIVDRESGASFFDLQGSRRLGRGTKLTLKARALTCVPQGDLMHTLCRDDYVQLEIAKYF